MLHNPSCLREPLMSHASNSAEPPIRSLLGVQIIGSGSYVPDNVVTNRHLFDSLGFDPDWIVNRTGIQERRFAAGIKRRATFASMPPIAACAWPSATRARSIW